MTVGSGEMMYAGKAGRRTVEKTTVGSGEMTYAGSLISIQAKNALSKAEMMDSGRLVSIQSRRCNTVNNIEIL